MVVTILGRKNSLSLSRRQFALGASLGGATLAVGRWVPTVNAQAADLASLGYPTIDVTITADAFEGIPETLEAGRYLLNATTTEDLEDGGAVAFLSPFGMSPDEFLAFLGGGAPAASPVAASPVADAPADEEGGEEEGPLPTFVYQSKFAGGVLAGPFLDGSAVIDLTEGEWLAWGDDPESSQAPVILTVTGDFPADVAEPAADVMASLLEFDIMIEGNLVAGDHTFRIENLGGQPHFLELNKLPDGSTEEDLSALMDFFASGTPVVSNLTEADLQPVTYSPTQSIGTVTWTNITLEAGTYAAMCFFPTAGVGDPHAFHGMHTVFDVM